MESYKKLHFKISSRSIFIVFMTFFILAFIVFYFTRQKIKNEYIKRLEFPGHLIEKNVMSYEIINNREFIKSLIGEDIVQCVIIGINGKIYYSVSKSLIGKDVWDIKELNNIDIVKGSFKEKLNDRLNYFTNITTLYDKNNEPLGNLYIKTKKNNFKKEIRQLLIIYMLGVVIMLILVYILISRLIKNRITNHLGYLLDSSKELNHGNLNYAVNKIGSDNEMGILEKHHNNLVLGLREKTNFAIEIRNKNFDYEYNPLSEKDELGKALVELRNSLKKATEEEGIRKNNDEINSWLTNGVAKFSEILRKDIENMEQLGYSVISNLVEYLDANQGGFFLIEEDEISKETVIELKAAYALNRKKHYDKKMAIGEGLIGSCIQEGKPIYMTNLPDDYINISSGLGESNPKCLLIMPLSSGEIKYGAIEIASFKEMEEHHIDFVNRISEIIASTISTVRNNIKTQKLLKETQEQAERIKQTEEELRQNMEEMHATQEEVERTNKQLRKNEEILKKQAEELAKEKYLMDALMDNVPDYIYFKDIDSKFIKNSKSHAFCFGHKDPKEIIGKSDFDFFDDEHARPAFNDEQNIIKTGKPIIDLIEKETHTDGNVTWVTTTKMPLRDQYGKIVGTFGISKDITSIKILEQEAVKAKENLEYENILFTTLMDNIAARVTIKDLDAKHIRINKMKADRLGLKDPSEIFGKTDPEVFGDTHTEERLKKEIEQIRSGVSSLHVEEFYKQKDGKVGWGSTSRLPIKNKNNEIIGGLVITWDITERKNAIFELELYKDILNNIFKELTIVFYKIDKNIKITEISGKGLNLLKYKNEKDATEKFFITFPELNKRIKNHSGEQIIETAAEITVDKKNLSVRHFVVPNKMTLGGFTGYTIIHKIIEG